MCEKWTYSLRVLNILRQMSLTSSSFLLSADTSCRTPPTASNTSSPSSKSAPPLSKTPGERASAQSRTLILVRPSSCKEFSGSTPRRKHVARIQLPSFSQSPDLESSGWSRQGESSCNQTVNQTVNKNQPVREWIGQSDSESVCYFMKQSTKQSVN